MLVSESASLLTGEEVERWSMGERSFKRNVDLTVCTTCRKFIQCKSLKKHMMSAEHNTNCLAIYAATYGGDERDKGCLCELNQCLKRPTADKSLDGLTPSCCTLMLGVTFGMIYEHHKRVLI